MIPLHPKFIHFPIALTVIAVFIAVLAIIFKNKRDFFKELLFWNLLFAAIGAVFTVITGIIAENNLVHNNAIHELMETHQLLGGILTVGLILSVIWLFVRKTKMQIKELILFFVFLFVLSGVMGFTAELGGKMVYEQGAGIIPMEDMIMNSPHDHNSNNHTH